jgi:hypothetical protein
MTSYSDLVKFVGACPLAPDLPLTKDVRSGRLWEHLVDICTFVAYMNMSYEKGLVGGLPSVRKAIGRRIYYKDLKTEPLQKDPNLMLRRYAHNCAVFMDSYSYVLPNFPAERTGVDGSLSYIGVLPDREELFVIDHRDIRPGMGIVSDWWPHLEVQSGMFQRLFGRRPRETFVFYPANGTVIYIPVEGRIDDHEKAMKEATTPLRRAGLHCKHCKEWCRPRILEG